MDWLFEGFTYVFSNAISRIMGFLMICIGVQFVINGVLDIAAGATQAATGKGGRGASTTAPRASGLGTPEPNRAMIDIR